MSAAGSELRRSVAGGVIWTASSQVARQAIQVCVTAVLARHLLPDAFGLIGMASVAMAFAAPLNEMGLSAALVQKKDLAPSHASAVFCFQVAVAAAAATVLFLAAPWVALFFRREELVPLLRIMCWNLPMSAAAMAPQALLLKQMRFGTVAAAETLSLAGAGAVGAAMALAGWGVWSLVGQSLAGTALMTSVLVASSGLNPLSRAARPTRAHLKDLMGFSAPLAGYQALNFASRNLDDILIGRFLGAESLGYYSMAYRVMMYPLQKVSGVVGRVSFPAYALMQDDVARIRRGYLKAIQYIALITFPMMAGVMVVAPELTQALFGPGWEPVAPLILVLSLAGMTGSIGTTVGGLFLAKGRAGLMLRWEIAASACYAAAIVAGLSWGLMGVAVGYTATALVLWPISHIVANRLIDLPMRQFFAALAPPAGLAAMVAALLVTLRLVWAPEDPAARMAFLVACAVAGGLAYATAAVVGRPAAVGDALKLARETLSGGIR